MAVAFRKLSGFRVYCDESNTDSHKPHPVYGAILVALDDIGKVQQELAEWRRREEMHGELKWEKVHGGLRLKKYKSFVDLFFRSLGSGSYCTSKPSSLTGVRLNTARIARETTN